MIMGYEPTSSRPLVSTDRVGNRPSLHELYVEAIAQVVHEDRQELSGRSLR